MDNTTENKVPDPNRGRKLAGLVGIVEPEIRNGDIVLYSEDGGHYRVSKVTKNTVNLCGVFGRKVYFKGVDKSKVKEDRDSWYEGWSKSETYMCM
jgi:hypothetical protein